MSGSKEKFEYDGVIVEHILLIVSEEGEFKKLDYGLRLLYVDEVNDVIRNMVDWIFEEVDKKSYPRPCYSEEELPEGAKEQSEKHFFTIANSRVQVRHFCVHYDIETGKMLEAK